jgi:hypothetical protein
MAAPYCDDSISGFKAQLLLLTLLWLWLFWAQACIAVFHTTLKTCIKPEATVQAHQGPCSCARLLNADRMASINNYMIVTKLHRKNRKKGSTLHVVP